MLDRSTRYLDTLVNTGYSGPDLELTVYNPSSWYRRDQVSVTVDLPGLTGLILLDPDDNPKPVLLTDVSRDGHWALESRLRYRGDNLFLLDLAAGGETLLTPPDGPGTFSGAHFAPDGRAIYLAADADRDLDRLLRL